MSSFNAFALTRPEMKNVGGGTICSIAFDLNGGCGNFKILQLGGDQSSAVAYANSMMGDGITGYNIQCS